MLTGNDIVQRCIVAGIRDESQIQPAGVDVTVKSIEAFNHYGRIDFDNSRRELPKMTEWTWEFLPAGVYLVRLNEVISVPLDYVGLMRPRSSLLRMGATIYTAIWDPGYTGKSQVLLHVINPSGLELLENAKIGQVVFMKMEETAQEGYKGIYQGEWAV